MPHRTPLFRTLSVCSALSQVTLTPYADRVCGSYSGGNKRKLSLAIALVGSPAVVFLDEPSSGMDPVSRRHMWEIIMRERTLRSIVLTTHSMEECEALCTRIGIMTAGRLQCLGGQQHLKTKYGGGYMLELRVADGRCPRACLPPMLAHSADGQQRRRQRTRMYVRAHVTSVLTPTPCR